MKAVRGLLALISVVALAGAASVTVQMTSSDKFVPATITVPRGGTVTWENDSPGVHTVTDNAVFASVKQDASMPAGAEPFNSGNIDPGNKFSHTLRRRGPTSISAFPRS